MSFVDADITVDPTDLITTALDQLNALLEAAGMPGWNSADADLLVIFLTTVAQIAADLNTATSQVLPAIFRAYGTQLLGIPYNNGSSAMVSSTFNFTTAAPDSVSYLIQGQTAVTVSGQIFYTAADYTANEGDISAAIQLVASDTGTAYNGLGGIGDSYPDVQLLNGINWVSTVQTNAVSSGGTDQETDEDYGNRLAAVLKLQAPRPITASDFADFVVSDIAEAATGVAVGRSTAIDGYYPVARTLSTGGTGPTPLTLTGSLTSGSAAATITTPPYPLAIPFPSATVTGTGIPSSTTILASPAPTATSFSMSANASANETNETITVTAWQSVERCVTIFVTDAQGAALTNLQMDTLQAWLNTYREQNFLVFVEPPTSNTIYVSAEVHVLPSYVGAEPSVEAGVQQAIISYFNPFTWGNVSNQGGVNSWLNATSGFNVVRYTSLYGVIENVPGVQYVDNSSLKLGFSASPSGTSDITMTGAAPLPVATTSSVVITSDN
jgi:hypothetical protein